MFKVIDICNQIHDVYGTFIDEDGDVQFVLCNSSGEFYKTKSCTGYYKLYKTEEKEVIASNERRF